MRGVSEQERSARCGGRMGRAHRVGMVKNCRCWNSRQLGLAQGLAEFPEAQEVAGLQRLMFLQMYRVMIAMIL